MMQVTLESLDRRKQEIESRIRNLEERIRKVAGFTMEGLSRIQGHPETKKLDNIDRHTVCEDWQQPDNSGS